MRRPHEDPRASDEPPPPVLGRWSRLYAVVIVLLAMTIFAMGWLTAHFR